MVNIACNPFLSHITGELAVPGFAFPFKRVDSRLVNGEAEGNRGERRERVAQIAHDHGRYLLSCCGSVSVVPRRASRHANILAR